MFLTEVLHTDSDLDMATDFGSPICQILAPYLDFEGAKNIHVTKVLILGFEGHWRCLIRVWHLDLDLHMVTFFDAQIF